MPPVWDDSYFDKRGKYVNTERIEPPFMLRRNKNWEF